MGPYLGDFHCMSSLLSVFHTGCRDSVVLEVPKLSWLLTVSVYLNCVCSSLSFVLEYSCATVKFSRHFQAKRIPKSSICEAVIAK